MQRVALVFDDQLRPETTGVYCRRALAELAQVEHFQPSELARIPRSGFDLYLNIDDGLNYPFPDDLRPSAYWVIDTHLDFATALSKARGFDHVFAAQRDGARQLQAAGVRSAKWLPLACDPAIHRRHDSAKRHDACFVGNVFPGARADLLRLLQQHLPEMFVGQAYFEEMAEIYSASRIVFNCSLANDVNMRVFEALACGSLLLTNELSENGQNELFQDGRHLATYQDSHDLLDKLQFYLRRPDVRERIAAAGRQDVLAKHTYRHRMQRLLQEVIGAPSRTSAAKPLPKPHSATNGAVNGTRNCHSSGNVSAQSHPKQIKTDLSYYDFARPEVLELIPPTARRVLEIGCGTGRFGPSLKARQAAEVVGVERQPEAAAIARRHLDQVIEADAEQLEPSAFAESAFDVIVCADVLEHLQDAEGLLKRVSRWLAPDGLLIASIPNVRHHSVVSSLLDGNWSYEPAGLLDHTHLRFFTRRDIQALLSRAGYQIHELAAVPGPGYAEWQQQGSPGEVRLGRALLKAISPDEAQEFYVYQWLITARRATNRKQATIGEVADSQLPRCLVLMVTYNRLEYTRLAIESALAQDYPNWELIVWDNASTDGTVEYVRERLKGVRHARLLASDKNLGVVYPMNAVWWSDQTAPLVAKIDNDTLVPPDMLRQLAACHVRSAHYGVLSGFHFRPEGEQAAKSKDIVTHDGVKVLSQEYVGGCAVMLRREVLAQLGPIGCHLQDSSRPFMDSGWTFYQQQIARTGLVNGYPWPPIHVDHMEDTRSEHCIRTPEHQGYKQALRGMSLEEFTDELCVWRPH